MAPNLILSHETTPTHQYKQWLHSELRTGSCEMELLNGYGLGSNLSHLTTPLYNNTHIFHLTEKGVLVQLSPPHECEPTSRNVEDKHLVITASLSETHKRKSHIWNIPRTHCLSLLVSLSVSLSSVCYAQTPPLSLSCTLALSLHLSLISFSLSSYVRWDNYQRKPCKFMHFEKNQKNKKMRGQQLRQYFAIIVDQATLQN